MSEPWQSREWHEQIRQSMDRVQALRSEIVAVAEREYEEWHNPNLTETSVDGRALVQTYWEVGVNRTVSDANLSSATWQDANPWSSAFVSYVMREAGAGSDFRYAWAHAVYIVDAINNRRNQSASIFKGYRPHERPVEPGDIIARARESSGATYDNIRVGMLTHGDIVTFVDPAARVVHAMGGNVHNNVDRKTNLTVNADGCLTSAGYFVVIKIDPYIPPLSYGHCPVHPERSRDSFSLRSWRRPGVVDCFPDAFGPTPEGGGFGDDGLRCTCGTLSRGH